MSAKIPPRLSAWVSTRAGGRCEYCHAPQVLLGQAFHIDHLIPRAAGGKTTSENLGLACSHCNFAKGVLTEAKDPRTGRQVPLFNPRLHLWEEHFRWSQDWSRLLGRTSVGRASVEALNMNARLLQRARPYWRAVGLLP